MRRWKWLIAGALASLACPVAAAPVGAVSKPKSKATLQKPLTLIRLGDLDFGTVVTSPLSGAVAIDSVTGKRTLSGGVSAGPSNAGQRATFRLTGAPATNVLLFVTPPTALSNAVGDSVSVLALTLEGAPVRTISASTGQLEFGVGGVISIAANQPDGNYSAEFDVTALYF